MPEGTCSVTDCSAPIKRRGYCYGHYMKNWRYGTPTPQHTPGWVDIRGRRFGTLVVTERRGSRWLCKCDCGRERLCPAGDLNRAGQTSTCGHRPTHHRTDTAGYTAAHQRVRQDRGLVQLHDCVNCGRPARHWSYDHDDPDELYADVRSANLAAYSLKPEHYSPRCVPCHKRYDLDRLDAADVPMAG